MTREEAISCIKQIKFRGYLRGANPFYEQDTEALDMAIQALSQEPCEKQIKIGTKVRTTKDKDFACEKVFPVGTIGIVEHIDKDDNLPYKIVANNDYFYYSRDMFEIIEDVEPCDDAISREDATAEFIKWQTEVAYAFGRDYLGVRIIQSAIDTIRDLPSVTQSRPIDIEIRDLKWQIASKDQVIEDIKNDIRHIVDEESEIDEKWARGLHYALCIIEKHWKCGARMVEPQERSE